jgi:hypothetical protein
MTPTTMRDLSDCTINGLVGAFQFSRKWAMPNADTFSIPIIGQFVTRHIQGLETVVDPFARNKRIAKWTNDINPDTQAEYHMEARDFLQMLIEKGIKADALIFDPPYSPRQVQECYAAAGLTPTMKDTQTARMKKECRDLMRQIVKRGGKVLSFGWNTVGMGPGWITEEIMLVCHGGDHNDTICLAERHDTRQGVLFE